MGGEQHRVRNQRGEIVAAAEGRDQILNLLFGLAQGVKPAGARTGPASLGQRFEFGSAGRARLCSPACVQAIGPAGQQHSVAGLQPRGQRIGEAAQQQVAGINGRLLVLAPRTWRQSEQMTSRTQGRLATMLAPSPECGKN